MAAASPGDIKSGKEEGSIDIEMFKKLVADNPDAIFLVDVRDPEEYTAGHIKTAVHMTVDDVEQSIQTLPTDKPIVFVCSTGARSGESYYMVKDLRPEIKQVYFVDAEVTYAPDGSFKIAALK